MSRFIISHFGYDDKGPFYDLEEPVYDDRGRALEIVERPVLDTEAVRGLDVRSLRSSRLNVDGDARLGDFLHFPWRRCLIVRESVVSAIESAGVRLDPDIHLLPLLLTHRQTGLVVGRYSVLWPLVPHAVLDLDKSDVECFPGTDVVWRVRKWVIDGSKEPRDVDLYATTYSEWICTTRINEMAKKENWSGVVLKKIA